jgi:hypothetical protein
MPFHFGQFYVCDEGGQTRQVMVLTARNNGEEALLRYIDTRVEEWTKWSEFDWEKWRRSTSEKKLAEPAVETPREEL